MTDQQLNGQQLKIYIAGNLVFKNTAGHLVTAQVKIGTLIPKSRIPYDVICSAAACTSNKKFRNPSWSFRYFNLRKHKLATCTDK